MEAEENPLTFGHAIEYLPNDQIRGYQKHFQNQQKLEEHNQKYHKIPNKDLFKDELNKPEEEKVKFGIKPVDPEYYRKNFKKNTPTLPNKMMRFEEMMRHLSAVMKSIKKLNPIGKRLSEKYQGFVGKVKTDIMTKNKGKDNQFSTFKVINWSAIKFLLSDSECMSLISVCKGSVYKNSKNLRNVFTKFLKT